MTDVVGETLRARAIVWRSRMRYWRCCALVLLITATTQPSALATIEANDGAAPDAEIVVLLHGLARTSGSMNKLQAAFTEAGYETCNIDYPSTRHRIETLAAEHIMPTLNACMAGRSSRIHFVTHSMGGILARYLAKHRFIDHLGRAVMLSPPSQGSEVVDALGGVWAFEYLNGPAGKELGTGADSMPLKLGAVGFDVGVITGSRSINPILSLLIDGTDDGKVSIERAKLEGMRDFLVLPATHTFIMRNDEAIAQSLHFIRHGAFAK